MMTSPTPGLNTAIFPNKETESPTPIPSGFNDLMCSLWTKLTLLKAKFTVYFSNSKTHLLVRALQ